MTAPLPTGLPASLTPPPADSIDFPLSWLLQHASAPIQYRCATEIARLPLRDPVHFAVLPYSHLPALELALMQQPDGTWGGSMLGVPSPRAEHFQGVGTISAVRRLLEYGWDRESPPLIQARRILFRLLAEEVAPQVGL